MTWREYLSESRERYVEFYRSVLREKRAEGIECTAEVWIDPEAEPGKKRPEHPLCVDILIQAADGPTMGMIAREPIEGRLVERAAYGRATLRVYEFYWETAAVWMRHPEPDWQLLTPWRAKWMNPERSGDSADDGLSGVVHYLGDPVSEGGGWLFEVDFGSVPLEALIELLDIFRNMGATEIEIGRSDGSDLPAEVLAGLAKPELTMESLAAMMMQTTRALQDVEEVRQVNEEQIDIRMRGDKEGRQCFLGNLHRLMQRVGVEARPRELYRFARAQREFELPQTLDLDQLRLSIKDQRFIANVREQAPTLGLLSMPFAADMSLVAVWDQPNGMRFVSEDEAEKYGMTREQMIDRARQNTVKEHAPAEVEQQGNLWVARTGDCYDASLLLDEAWVAEMAGKVKGELLACVPARHVVLLGDSLSVKAAVDMIAIGRKVEAGGDHLISNTILVWREEKWQAFPPTLRYTQPAVNPDAGPSPVAGETSGDPPKKPWWRVW